MRWTLPRNVSYYLLTSLVWYQCMVHSMHDISFPYNSCMLLVCITSFSCQEYSWCPSMAPTMMLCRCSFRDQFDCTCSIDRLSKSSGMYSGSYVSFITFITLISINYIALWGRSNGASGHSMSSSSSIASSNAALGTRLVPSVNGSTWGRRRSCGTWGYQSSAPTTSTRCHCSPVPQMGRMCNRTACRDTLPS